MVYDNIFNNPGSNYYAFINQVHLALLKGMIQTTISDSSLFNYTIYNQKGLKSWNDN